MRLIGYKYIVGVLSLYFIAGSSIMVSQTYPIHYAPQAEACAHLGPEEISDCTDELIFNELFRAMDITSCFNTDSSHFYNLILEMDIEGVVVDSRVTSWNDKDSKCLDYFNKKANDIAQVIKFEPAKDQKRQPLAGPKYFDFNYPHSPLLDSIRALEKKTTVIEHMPRFTGCEHIVGSSADKKRCADRELLTFLYTKLKYPKKARENGVQGLVYVQYIVEPTGLIDSIVIVRDIGAGCGDAVLSVVNQMNDLAPPFIPGMQMGKAVRVLYTLPVTFKLEDRPKKGKKDSR